jgi:two-component system, chemotaxis family, sensor kinase CheA
MNEMLEQQRGIYIEEARELLTELESGLLELEDSPSDTELVDRVFRALHTIKGSGAMFGFDSIAYFLHDVETAYDQVRNGKLAVTRQLINLTLAACDIVHKMLEGQDTDEEAAGKAAEFRTLLSVYEDASETMAKEAVEGPKEKDRKWSTFRIRFEPSPDILATGTNPCLLLNELRELGKCLIFAQTDRIPDISEIDPESCHFYWDIILSTSRDIDAIRDVFIFVEDRCELRIEEIDKEEQLEVEKDYKRLGDILIERGDVSRDDLHQVLNSQKPIGALLVEAGVVTPDKVESALAEQKCVRDNREKRLRDESVSSIRVASDKLDRLVNLVGELVTIQAQLSQNASSSNDGSLVLIAEEVERLTAELRDSAMSIRMLPIGSTFGRFRRLVRDLSADLGKEVDLTTDGGETELDKTVIERLNDPLVHLIRNSMDHGIETPEKREAQGKARQGLIHLSAEHSGAHVLIHIEDDGAGIDVEAVKAKATEKGLLTSEIQSDKDIFSLIFAPGFSTARELTNVSGRGVGMDVVKKTIDALRGSVEVSSTKGKGTRITLKLPLTLAIIEGLLVKTGDEFFVIPLSSVEECIELTRLERAKAHNRHLVNVRGSLIPYISLREQFYIGGDRPDIEQIVIAGLEDHRVGIAVDVVVGEFQTVIKSLGRFYRDAHGVSGATILGDGQVALILDIARLMSIAITDEEERLKAG